MDEEKLIEYVRKYPYLYDLNHPKYTDSIKKEHTWKEIGQKLKQPTEACKQRWQSLRDCFRRTLNKRKIKSSKTAKKWKYEEEMGFLTPYFTKKTTSTSLEVSSEEETPDAAIVESVYTEQSIDSSSSDAATVNDDTIPAQANTQRVATSTAANNNLHPVVRKRKSNHMQAPTTATNSSSLLMTISSADEKRQKFISDYDELDYFFFNISATVRKFSPYQQAIAKNKIFSLVSDMEIQQFAANSNFDNTTTSSIPSPASTNWTLSATSILPTTANNWKEEQQ